MPTIAAQTLREYLESRYSRIDVTSGTERYHISLNADHLVATNDDVLGGGLYVHISYADPKLFELLDQYIPPKEYVKIWGGEYLWPVEVTKPELVLLAVE